MGASTTPAASGFGTVIILVGENYSTDMPASGQQAIVDANANGTGVVLTEWAANHVEYGRWRILSPLLLLARTSGIISRLTFSADDPTHPVWNGLPASFTTVETMGANIGDTLVNGGARIASCAECGAGVVVRESRGRVVQIAHAANYSAAGRCWTSDTNIIRLMTNSVGWSARCF